MRTENPSMANNKVPRVEVRCYYCQREGSERPSHFARKKRHFCSMQCYALYRKHYLPKEEHNCYGKGLPEDQRKLRQWCRSTANHAIRDGVLTRKPCQAWVFGKLGPCGKWAEAHHEDYTQPLKVRWLCFTHHRHQHKDFQIIYEHPQLLEGEGQGSGER